MSRTDAFYSNHSVYVNAALVATHANCGKEGFRQKDVRFYIELLTNWAESSFKGAGLIIKNTQIQRLLDGMTEEGLLKRTLKKNNPTYVFSSIGLLEIITRLVNVDELKEPQDFYFLYHCVALYSDKMKDFLIGEKQSLPKSYQMEIQHLLDPRSLIERQKSRLSYEINKLVERISEAKQMSEYAKKKFEKNNNVHEVVLEIERKFPYQLNNQKRMSELFKTLSPDIQLLEITEAPAFRAKTLWEPLKASFESHLKLLETL